MEKNEENWRHPVEENEAARSEKLGEMEKCRFVP